VIDIEYDIKQFYCVFYVCLFVFVFFSGGGVGVGFLLYYYY